MSSLRANRRAHCGPTQSNYRAHSYSAFPTSRCISMPLALRVRSAGKVVGVPSLGVVAVLTDGQKQFLALEGRGAGGAGRSPRTAALGTPGPASTGAINWRSPTNVVACSSGLTCTRCTRIATRSQPRARSGYCSRAPKPDSFPLSACRRLPRGTIVTAWCVEEWARFRTDQATPWSLRSGCCSARS